MLNRKYKALEYQKIIEKLIEKTETSLGKKLAENIQVENNIEVIKELQEETEEGYQVVVKRGNPPLGGVSDVENELTLAEKGGMLSPRGLFRIADTLRGSRKVRSFLWKEENSENSTPRLKDIAFNLSVFRIIEESIYNAILGEEEVSDSASKELGNIRRKIRAQNDSMKTKLNSLINSSANKKYLQDSIVTIREGRYVVPVKQEYRGNFKGIVHDQSSSGATLFIEPLEIVNLNNELRELHLSEKAEIERILQELSQKVGEVSYDVKENLKILGKIDFVFAKAKLSVEMNGTKPIVNDRKYINIKNGRHPLIGSKEVVPMSFYIGDETNTIVVTGPNTGGKTVTLKTVGLFVLMTQSGMQIPADSNSQIAVFENVFADIGDEQSIEQNLSTFSSHMTNIVNILRDIDENSLVLFDELGAGTDPTEGAALAIAILDYLKERNIRTLATTHYSELKLYALSTESVENASVEFNVDTLRPTYKLLIGVPGKSNAFAISSRLGLEDNIIDRAQKLMTKDNVQFEDILSKLEKDRRETEKSKKESEILESELERLKEQLEKERKQLKDNKNDILNQAKREAKKILSLAKKDSEDILDEFKDIWSQVKDDRQKQIDENKEKLKTKIGSIDDSISEELLAKTTHKPIKEVKIGEEVKIISLNQIGTVISKPDQDKNVQIQVGIMKISVPLNTLSLINEKNASKETNTYAKSMIKSKVDGVKSELDIRGKNIEESMIEIDKYLDDAYITGHSSVYIIHGKGTGALRAGVSDILKRSKHVKSYRLGNYGEGGTGVTVVEIK